MDEDTPATPDPGPGIETRRLQAALESRLFGHRAAPTFAGRFEVLGRLGQGAMGTVYRARDPELDRELAVKVLRPGAGTTADTDGTARLRREARALARLSHPNVVEVLDVGVQDGQVFVAMEFVRGRTLAQWAEATPQDVPDRLSRVLGFAIEAAQGLSAAHAADVVHRDVKPQNMLVGDDGRLRLADFGLARGTLDDSLSAEVSTTGGDVPEHVTLSSTGMVVGTPAYMSPEQFEGRFDERSDQFSLCVSFWEAAFGPRPFPGATVHELIASVVAQRVRVPSSRDPDARWFASILKRGLAENPSDRHASMAALAEALAEGPPSSRKPWLLWGTGAATLACGALAVAAASAAAPPQRCATVAEPADAVWTEKRSELLSAAPALWEPIDRYVQSWVGIRKTSCEAAWRNDAPAVDQLDPTMRCLQRRLDQLDVFLAAVVARGTVEPSDELANVVRAWPSPQTCTHSDAVRAEFTLPADPALAQQVRLLERDLMEDTVRETVDPATVSHARSSELVQRARRIGHEPLLSLALEHLGERQILARDVAAAQTLTEASQIAARLGLFRAAVRASTSAASAFAVVENRHEDAERSLREAEAMLQRVDEPRTAEQVELTYVRASSFLAQGRAADAAESLHAQLRNEHRPLDEARLREALGSALAKLGRYDESIATSSRAAELYRLKLGPDHHVVASALNAIALVEMERGNPNAAIAGFTEVRRIVSKLVGEQHPIFAGVEGNLGTAYMALGDRDRAEVAHRHALEVFDATLGEADPQRSVARVHVAAFLPPQEAEVMLNQALALAEEHSGADSVPATSARSSLGALYLHQKRFERAEAALRRSLEHHERFQRKLRVAFDQASLARALALQDKLVEARPLAEKALTTAEELLSADAPELIGPLFAAAVAHRDQPERARAWLRRALALPNVASMQKTTHEDATAFLSNLDG